MPLLFIDVQDADFCTRDSGTEYDHPKRALAVGVESAIAIAADQVKRGELSAAVVVSVENEAGACILSSVVAVSVSSLTVPKYAMDPVTYEG